MLQFAVGGLRQKIALTASINKAPVIDFIDRKDANVFGAYINNLVGGMRLLMAWRLAEIEEGTDPTILRHV